MEADFFTQLTGRGDVVPEVTAGDFADFLRYVQAAELPCLVKASLSQVNHGRDIHAYFQQEALQQERK